MQPSMEVRWFLQGDIPAEIDQWFKRGYVPAQDAALKEERRDDTYLSLPKSTDLGIKLREGKNIEIKQRQGDGGLEVLRDGIEGQVEQWVKWSFILDQDAKSPDISIPEGSWITVKKWRLTRKFEIKAEDQVEAIDASLFPDEGCNMELAKLTTHRDQIWWSLGFEAFGQIGAVEKNLYLVLAQVLADPDFPTMKVEHSYSYPKWLAMVEKGETPEAPPPLRQEEQMLKQLNEEIGEREKVGDSEYFTKLLTENFIFRRANGVIVDKSEYIDGLASVVENSYEQLDTHVESVTVNGNSAVVNAIVTAKRRNMEHPGEFKNVRVFRQENDDWRLAIWINTKIRDL